MKRQLKKILVIVTILLISNITFASSIDKNAGTSASSFLKIGSGSAYAQALGNSVVSVVEGMDAMYVNPAGAATVDKETLGFSYLTWLQGYKAQSLGYLKPMGANTVLGFSGSYYSMDFDEGDLRDSSGIPITDADISIRNLVVTSTLATTAFEDFLRLGGTVRYISENNGINSYTTLSFDLGAQLNFWERFYLGGALQNIGDKNEVPTAGRIGAAFRAKYWTLSGELVDYVDDKPRHGIGFEVHIPDDILHYGTFALRAGYYNRDEMGISEDDRVANLQLDRTSKISLGFGMKTNNMSKHAFSIDYAMTPYGALGEAHQLTLGLGF